MSVPNKKMIAQQLRCRRDRTSAILGGALPGTSDRLAGCPPAGGSEAADRMTFLKSVSTEVRPELVSAVEIASHATAQPDDLWYLVTLLDSSAVERELRDRLYLYLALEFGDQDAQDSLARIVRTAANHADVRVVDLVYGLAFATLLDSRPVDIDSAKFVVRLNQYVGILANDAEDILAVKAALDDIENAPAQTEILSPLNALSRLAHKLDVSERTRATKSDDADVRPNIRALVVVPALGEPTGSSGRNDTIAQFKPVGGVALPLADDADLSRVRSKLAARYPHLATEVDLILRQRQPYRLLLVGSPGCGKTSFARDLADQLGLASIVYTAGGTADSSFAGTSAQWATSRASTPLQLVLRSRRANPLIVLDELEKTGDSRHNGSLVDALLSFLEPSSARRILDPALEVECDLSAVSYVATANSLDGVPGPLRDRLRVIRMPDPRPEHLSQLLSTMFDDIAADQGLDRRWLQPLANDELEIVQEAWPGGSLRRLRRVLELMLDGREQQIGRA